jgi:hypothetical protein
MSQDALQDRVCNILQKQMCNTLIQKGVCDTLQKQMCNTFTQAADALRNVAGLPGKWAEQVATLMNKVDEPCVVAVVGRVKAGKSTFINALLGVQDDLAPVGTTETTATINYFRYGTPDDPARPVRCYYRNGQDEYKDVAFLKNLQGNDLATLQRAKDIDRLEYRLPLEFLRDVTLVDTPGTEAVVSEHSDRTDEYILRCQLRDRHNQETRSLEEGADAVIYVIGYVPRASDRDFLEEFSQVTQGRARALNAIGVMGKIDLSPEVLQRRAELAAKVAVQLKDNLNTVAPVSAGIQRALDRLLADDGAGLERLQAMLRTIPAKRLDNLLDNSELYLDFDFDDCPVSRAERQELLGGMDWMVFTTLARSLADPARTLTEVCTELLIMAGFQRLREVLEQHFFKRGKRLHCFRLLGEARRLVQAAQRDLLPQVREREREHAARQQRFVTFLRQAGGDPVVAQELVEFIEKIAVAPAEPVEAALDKANRLLSQTYHQLEEHNADFNALQTLERNKAAFTPEEWGELRALLGLNGLDLKQRLPDGATLTAVENRQRYWRNVAQLAGVPVRRAVAERAAGRLGWILDELEGHSTD